MIHPLDVRLVITHTHIMMLNERFWNKVNKSAPNGCWEWTSSVNNMGYGLVSVRYLGHKHKKLAHRLAFEERNGPFDKGLYVLHKCDNPKCVNPDHLFLGNDLDNVRDMWAKGRASPPPRNDGEKKWNASITNDTAKMIRELHGRGKKVTQIAKSIGVSRYVVGGVVNGRTYKDC